MQLGVGISLVSDSLGLRINARTKIKIIIDVQLTLYKQKTRALPTELEKAKVLVLVGVLPCRRVYHTSAERENLMQWYFCTSHVGPNIDQNQFPFLYTWRHNLLAHEQTDREKERTQKHENAKKTSGQWSSPCTKPYTHDARTTSGPSPTGTATRDSKTRPPVPS